MFKADNKEMFQKCYSGVFIISLENIFESVTESDFRKIFRSLYK